jgi:hypothetical protein
MPRLRPSEHTGKIISTLIKLKSRGLAQGTLRNVAFQLKHLAKSVDIDSPAEVKAYIAKNLKEACQLIESGFEYVTEIEGAKLFRKRK